MVSINSWCNVDYEGGWAAFAWKWKSADVPQEEDDNAIQWHSHSAKSHLHSQIGGFDESEWKEEERFALPRNIGKLQCRLDGESELLDAEQAATFRSGLGLALYLAMDRPDVQFAVKTLASYMSKPTIKALSALKHLASYLDGTADDGLLLQSADEGQCIFDAWRDDE